MHNTPDTDNTLPFRRFIFMESNRPIPSPYKVKNHARPKTKLMRLALLKEKKYTDTLKQEGGQ